MNVVMKQHRATTNLGRDGTPCQFLPGGTCIFPTRSVFHKIEIFRCGAYCIMYYLLEQVLSLLYCVLSTGTGTEPTVLCTIYWNRY